MSTHQISSRAKAHREQARRPDGKFGEQHLGEVGFESERPAVEPLDLRSRFGAPIAGWHYVGDEERVWASRDPFELSADAVEITDIKRGPKPKPCADVQVKHSTPESRAEAETERQMILDRLPSIETRGLDRETILAGFADGAKFRGTFGGDRQSEAQRIKAYVSGITPSEDDRLEYAFGVSSGRKVRAYEAGVQFLKAEYQIEL